ncbi:hypothetical protein [Streptomyces sp. NPDC088246]|uniref:hypothetical protein n=1 Tax=Streptomyces sp. NPDC088246 TaxID=3365842 RepID=UPI00381DC447
MESLSDTGTGLADAGLDELDVDPGELQPRRRRVVSVFCAWNDHPPRVEIV